MPASPAAGHGIYPDLVGCNEIYQWLHWKGPVNSDDMAARWGDWRSRGAEHDGVDYVFCLQDPASERPIGGLNLRFRGHLFCGDLGYWVLPEFQGAGVGSEAVGLATWLSFEHLAGQLMIAEVFVGNERSSRLLERQGFRRAEEAASAQLDDQGNATERPVWTYTLGRRTWLRDDRAVEPVAAEIVVE